MYSPAQALLTLDAVLAEEDDGYDNDEASCDPSDQHSDCEKGVGVAGTAGLEVRLLNSMHAVIRSTRGHPITQNELCTQRVTQIYQESKQGRSMMDDTRRHVTR